MERKNCKNFFFFPVQLQWIENGPSTLTQMHHINVTNRKNHYCFNIFCQIINSNLQSTIPTPNSLEISQCFFAGSVKGLIWGETLGDHSEVSFFWEDCQRHPGVCKCFHTSWALITFQVTWVSSWASSGSLSIVSSSIDSLCIALEWGGDLLSFR